MPRKIARAVSLDSDDLDSNTVAVPSSIAANSSRKASKSTTVSTLSDEDEEMEEVEQRVPRARQTRPNITSGRRAPSSRKRPASEALDNEDNGMNEDISKGLTVPDSYDTPITRLSKRVMREVYVEIPPWEGGRSSASSSVADLDLKEKFDRKGKGKGLPVAKKKDSAPSRKSPTRPLRKASRTMTASSGTELLSDTSLDYDDHLDDEEEVQDSEDDSGSNFELSDSDGGKDGLILMGSAQNGDDAEENESSDEVDLKSKSRSAKRQKLTGRSRKGDLRENEIPLAYAMAADDEEEAEMIRTAMEESKALPFPRRGAAGSSTTPYKTRRIAISDSEEDSLSELSDESSAHTSESDGGGFVVKKGAKAVKQTVKSKEKRKTKKQMREEAAARRNPGHALLQKERQKLGRKLTWAERTNVLLRLHHPALKDVWGDLEEKIQPIVAEKAEQPAKLKVTLLPFQQESLSWMRKQEETLWHGGCLADEMGMGKTIQTLALLVSDRTKPNLIVAPTVAIMQWKNEIEAHTTGFKIHVFHGSSREKDSEALEAFDVVLTTYSVMESTFRRQHKGFTRKGVILKESSVLHEVEWARVVLDEAHNIKERSSNTAKAAFELKAQYRWCLSGTPLQNRVGELYSIVRFLGGDPFSYYFCKNCPCKSLSWSFSDKKSCDDCGHSPMSHTCFWNNEILTPIQKHAMQGPGQTAFKKLKILLQRMMLRRTKLERADDLGLPPRTVIVRRDYFSPEEKELYLSLFSDAKRTFSTYVDAGTLLNNYSNVFTLITRMRQMACHPDLVLKSRTNQDFSADVVEATVCRLCNDIAEDAIESKCHHVFDRECIKQYIEISADTSPSCPVCHLALSIDLDAPAIEQEETVVKKARQGILGRLDLDTWRSSSKIEALVEELSNLRRDDRTTKSLVFSQFVNFLDLIAWRLQKAGFNICRLEGTMSPQARDLTIKHFMNNVDVTVFLVSLKAGGVALNLVEASRVYLMDSWWNPAVEFQAMDRIHRLGQHRPVHAIKLVIEDSIESRIVQLQEKKSAMVDATLSSDDSAMGRLTPEDLGFLFRL